MLEPLNSGLDCLICFSLLIIWQAIKNNWEEKRKSSQEKQYKWEWKSVLICILYLFSKIWLGIVSRKMLCISTFYIWDRLEFDVYFIKSQMEIICYRAPNCNASSAWGIKPIRLLNFGKPLKSQIPIYLKERNHKIGRQKIINHDHDKNNSQLPIFCTSRLW